MSSSTNNKDNKFLDDDYEGSDFDYTEESSSHRIHQNLDSHHNRNSSSATKNEANNIHNKEFDSATAVPFPAGPGPGSDEEDLFHAFTSPFVGAAKAVHDTFRFMTGRMTEEQIREKITKANDLREKVNRSLSRRVGEHVESQNKKIFVGTWNVAKQTPPSTEEMKVWINGNSTCKPASKADLPKIAVIGIQEATMSGAAMMLETTEAVAEWSEAFQAALHQLAKDAGHPIRYRKLDGVQLVGLIMLIFLPIDEFPYVRHLRTAVTRTGPLSTVGNKGAVGCRLTFHGKRFLFICGHFAPHEHNVKQRDHHYHSALDRLDLAMESESYDDLADFVLRLNTDQSVKNREMNSDGRSLMSLFMPSGVKGAGLKDRIFHRREFRKLKNSTERSRALLHAHDYCFFFGDLNYRLVKSADRDMIINLIKVHNIKQLLHYDELNLGLRKGYIFEGFHEPPLRFLPSYKFAPQTDSYDVSKRKPAWTDRVLVHCLNGTVEASDDTMDKDRTRAYLVTDEWKKKTEESGEAFLVEDSTAYAFMEDVDDARDHYALLKRSPSNMSFGSDDGYQQHSNKSTPPISPMHNATSSASNNKNNNSSNKQSPMNSAASMGKSVAGAIRNAFQNKFNPSPSHNHQQDSNENNNNSISNPMTPITLSPPSTSDTNNTNTNNTAGLFPSSSANSTRLITTSTKEAESLNDSPNTQRRRDSSTTLTLEDVTAHNDDHEESENFYRNANHNNGNNDDGNSSSQQQSPSTSPANMSPHQQQGMMPRSSASFEDFIRALDRCSSLNNTIENRVDVNWYCSVPSLQMSDHRPVAAAFDCNVAFLSKEQQEILVFDTKQELGLDFMDDLKYAT